MTDMSRKNKEIIGIGIAIAVAVVVLIAVLISKNNKKEKDVVATDEACNVNVGLIMGPPSMGLGYFMNEAEQGNTYNNYSFTVEGIDYSTLAAKLNDGTYDIITCPSNVSAILYNNKDLKDSVEVISINNLGLLHILTTDTNINSMEDLKGKTVYSIGEGGPPEYTFEYLLDKYGLKGEVNFSFRSTPFEVLNLLQDEPGSIALLPQPFVEVAKLLVDNLRTPIDVTEAWDELNVSSGAQSVTTVTIVRKRFLDEHRQAVDEYLKYAKKSTDYTLENVEQAAKWTEKYETFLNPDIAVDAIPQCSICTITGTEMKTILSGFLQIMYELNPDAVGGKMPDDAFYYIPEDDKGITASSSDKADKKKDETTKDTDKADENNEETTTTGDNGAEANTDNSSQNNSSVNNSGHGSGTSENIDNGNANGEQNNQGNSNEVNNSVNNSGNNTVNNNAGNTGGNIGSNTVNGGNSNNGGSQSNANQNNSNQNNNQSGSHTTPNESGIAAGTYTVTANIWFRKEDSGLPMNPHLTSPIFPPKDPVSDNATLTVDGNGNCSVKVPIVIQSKVMTIQQISGFSKVSIQDMEYDAEGNITSITLSLGKLKSIKDVVTDSCTVNLKMGDLAMSISGFSRDQTWPAQFQLN